jgi:hypothetical protein
MADTAVEAPVADQTPVTISDAAPEQAQTEEKVVEGEVEKKDNGESPAKERHERGDRNGRNGTEQLLLDKYKLT